MLRVLPSALLLSLVAFAPSLASAQTTRAGVVTTLEGNVTVTRVTLGPQPLKFKDDVFVNDKVTTGEQSIARMLLGGKAVVTVRERSTLTITEVPGKATIDLEAGKIALAVAKEKMRPGESIDIRAANVVAGIRGTVVVAEVSSASAQLGGVIRPTGTLWVLVGQIEAVFAGQPGNPVLVGALQQFRSGNVSNILPGQMSQILHGLSSGKMPLTTRGDEQAKETALNAGLELARSFSAVGGDIVPTGPLVNPTVPILPGNAPNFNPSSAAPASLTPPPPRHCDRHPDYSGYPGHGKFGRHGYPGGGLVISTAPVLLPRLDGHAPPR